MFGVVVPRVQFIAFLGSRALDCHQKCLYLDCLRPKIISRRNQLIAVSRMSSYARNKIRDLEHSVRNGKTGFTLTLVRKPEENASCNHCRTAYRAMKGFADRRQSFNGSVKDATSRLLIHDGE